MRLRACERSSACNHKIGMAVKIKIGILIGRRYLRSRKLLRKENPFFVDFPAILKRRGAEVVYFTPDNLPGEMPVFVYKAFNKYFSAAELGNVDAFYEQVRNGKVFLINSLKFISTVGDKWKLHRLLCVDPSLKKLLPDTFLLESGKGDPDGDCVNGVYKKGKIDPVLLKKMYPDFLLKPRRGADGIGIRRIRKLNNRQLGRYLKIPGDYVLQRFVDVPKVKGRVFDVRVVLYKEHGAFRPLAVYARIGAKGDFRSNISQGGRVVFLNKAAAFIPGKTIAAILRKAKQIACFIEKKSGYANICCADFMLDINGKIRFVEANSAPGWRWMYLMKKAGRDKVLTRMAAMAEKFCQKIISGKNGKKRV